MPIQETITAFKSSNQGKYAYLYEEDLPIPEEVNFYPFSMPPAIIYRLGLLATILFPLVALIQGFAGQSELFVVAIFLSIPFPSKSILVLPVTVEYLNVPGEVINIFGPAADI